jgi:hypothetical protein
MPSNPVSNKMFLNKGDFKFTDITASWGLLEPSFSNGSAYADLDNDGDLDLVVNNVNMPAFMYQNKTDTILNKSIQVVLKGHLKNTKAIGAKVEIYYNSNAYSVLENFPARGFQSAVSNVLTFGVGNTTQIDSLKVTWPDANASVSVFKDLKTNTKHTFSYPKLPVKTASDYKKRNSFSSKNE